MAFLELCYPFWTLSGLMPLHLYKAMVSKKRLWVLPLILLNNKCHIALLESDISYLPLLLGKHYIVARLGGCVIRLCLRKHCYLKTMWHIALLQSDISDLPLLLCNLYIVARLGRGVDRLCLWKHCQLNNMCQIALLESDITDLPMLLCDLYITVRLGESWPIILAKTLSI